MNNKKKALIAGASVLGCAAIGFGAFAYFFASAETTKSVTVGNVSISADSTLKHYQLNDQGTVVETPNNNLNPGDNDPDVPSSARPGTDHELVVNFSNTGNKSVITRVVATVTGRTGGTSSQELTQAQLEKLILSVDSRTTPVNGDTAQTTNKKQYLTKLDPTGTDPDNNNSLVYVYGGTGSTFVLNGTGANAETEAAANGKTSGSLKLDLGLDDSVTDLEGATFTINIEVQAMQYRNTGDAQWDTLFEDTYEVIA